MILKPPSTSDSMLWACLIKVIIFPTILEFVAVKHHIHMVKEQCHWNNTSAEGTWDVKSDCFPRMLNS